MFSLHTVLCEQITVEIRNNRTFVENKFVDSRERFDVRQIDVPFDVPFDFRRESRDVLDNLSFPVLSQE